MQKIISGTGAAKRRGFTLVELVIVVLVIGILTAVAAPKMMNTASSARMNGTKQSLAVLRDALELFRSQSATSAYPTTATIATGLAPYLSGPFPIAQVGTNQNAAVANSTQNPITTVEAGAFGWAYNQSTGEIRVNDASSIGW
jgi:general secretion pathway protein G